MTTGLDILNALESAGCTVGSDGRSLRLSGSRPDQNLLNSLAQHKDEVKAAWCQREWRICQKEQLRGWLFDPRPDLEQDSDRWASLLNLAYGYHGEGVFWWVLQGLRCLGARLALVDGRLTLQRGKEMSPEEYAEIKAQYLAPCASDVITLLDRVDEVFKLGDADHGNESASGLQATGQPVVGQDQQSLFSIRNY